MNECYSLHLQFAGPPLHGVQLIYRAVWPTSLPEIGDEYKLPIPGFTKIAVNAPVQGVLQEMSARYMNGESEYLTPKACIRHLGQARQNPYFRTTARESCNRRQRFQG